MLERLGEMRKRRRERIKKRSRERTEKETKDNLRQFEENEGLRDPSPFLEFCRSDPAMQPLFLQVLRV